jgi:putative nucleotidyltransferase with HDIG domain
VESIASLHMRTIEALALAIEAKDHTTNEHLQRVRTYAIEVGKKMGLSPEDLDALRAAALLHDIGKLAVPEHIISKPGRLTPEEFEKMKIHPVVGAEILERVAFPYPVAPIVRWHHERWDGSGYPDGLKGEEIPMGARILAAVDCLDALASDRQYRKALPLDDAMNEVEKMAGRSFDPDVVAILKQHYVELERLARGAAAQSRQTFDRRERSNVDRRPPRGSRSLRLWPHPAANMTFFARSRRPARKPNCCLKWCRNWATH